MNSDSSDLLRSFIILALVMVIAGCEDDSVSVENPIDTPYSVDVDSINFVTEITGNRYFPLVSGRTMIYEGENEEGVSVRVEEEYTGETKTILGVTCVVVNAREFEDGEPIENTSDWYAQDVAGNIWYFGEETKELEDGEVVSTEGSWEAGVDGALPGIIMLASPQPGVWYRQEYYEGEAEDVAQILDLSTTASSPYGTFSNCLQTAEWNPLEPGVVEHKFYAPEVGLIRVEAVEGETGFEELTEVEKQ